ncbi:MAG: recombinase family protein, partial [Alphaproteobacteria bacterium]|nr:recombinase family protein [Alphaproteobacteria bacterium]
MSKIRCAIYVRKSTEKGLEQDFNSLHNQEEACRNYILSQSFNGWEYSKTYEDGGISGGTMNRPGLKDMIEDIKSGKIQVVVVYKVDRLSRSIIDFHNMMKEFEQYNCNFVSITQSFDTSTSMGKLTLNMLLSFAQFEREVSSERIRDKLAASKAKGYWIGGSPPLGYNVVEKQLKVNEGEKEEVRYIFEKYLEIKSIRKLADYLNDLGYTLKKWISKSGEERGGGKFNKNTVVCLLKNKVYIGKIEHKSLGKTYEGNHDAIIDTSVFNRVQSLLDENRQDYQKVKKIRKPLLYKKLFSLSGEEFIKKEGTAHGRKYSYYIIRGKHLPMNQLDSVVIESVKTFLNGKLEHMSHHAVDQIKR